MLAWVLSLQGIYLAHMDPTVSRSFSVREASLRKRPVLEQVTALGSDIFNEDPLAGCSKRGHLTRRFLGVQSPTRYAQQEYA